LTSYFTVLHFERIVFINQARRLIVTVQILIVGQLRHSALVHF
jgi:hypothetical protein